MKAKLGAFLSQQVQITQAQTTVSALNASSLRLEAVIEIWGHWARGLETAGMERHTVALTVLNHILHMSSFNPLIQRSGQHTLNI